MIGNKAIKRMYQKLSRANKKIKACDVYISGNRKYGGWNLNESKWAIPQSLAKLKPDEMQTEYHQHLISSNLISQIPNIAYQTLGCWCETENICHAAVLNRCVREYLAKPTPNQESKPVPKLVIVKEPLITDIKFRIRKPRKVTVKRRLVSQVVPETIVVRPVVIVQPSEQFYTPLPFDPIDWTAPGWLPSRQITPDCVKKLKATTIDYSFDWFNCRIARIILNKVTNRFAMEITDGTTSTRVEVAEQLNEPLACRFITKDDLIHVEHFALTNIYNGTVYPDGDANDFTEPAPKPKLKKRFVMLTSIYKIF
jgi:hypothetical protein